jgi:4-aminobutyrate aminotransferase-like enzyme/Ser/Thr protein kinase RdoA (MazF antagonist)
MGSRAAGQSFDFFTDGGLPAPRIDSIRAEQLARELYGLEASATDLGSQQDANFLLRDPGGRELAVLKVANAAFDAASIDTQDLAAHQVAERAPGLRVSTRLEGREPGEVELHGAKHVVRLLSFLPGGTLHGSTHLSPRVIASMGEVSGRVSVALQDFEAVGLDRVLQWEASQAVRIVDALAPHVEDGERREILLEATRREAGLLGPLVGDLPAQAVHGDVTDDNLVRSVTDGLADGVIDFGDVVTSWAVSELAVTISSILHHDGARPADVLPAVEAFHALRPLGDAEVDALWPLVVLRGAVLVVSGHQQVALDGANDYAAAGMDAEWRLFAEAASVPSPVMAAMVRERLGLRDTRRHILPTGTQLLDGPDPVSIDLGAASPLLDDGAWRDPTTPERAAHSLLDEGATAVVARFGEVDATRSTPLTHHAQAVVRTGVDLWTVDDATLSAPWAADVIRSGSTVTLSGGPATLVITGLPPAADRSARVEPGDPFAVTAAGQRTRITAIRPDVDLDVPAYVTHELALGWLDVLVDAAPLLGLAPVDPDDAGLLERRIESLASTQEHYYARPPRIERGWQQHLISTDGRCYLDMVNNVTVLGHSHPRVIEAVTQQWKRLNTNSRFHYEAIVELSEKLTALLPEPLDTVFLVNSGSEANELALRLAIAATGRPDLVAVREAYHGWTHLADAVSTSTADNPRALETRPDWIHTVESPNAYRGRLRGDEAAGYGPEAARLIRSLADEGTPPAAFICEPYYGSAGGIPLPDGYLAEVYAAAREVGALTIADEVQVGLGRLGVWFWGFEQQDVVPDIVTIAKGLGDGHPLGAVVTSRELADRYASQGYFFSSTGGSPVSCVVGSTVLDVIAEEGLPAHALRVGTHLRRRLQALAERYPIVGAVHGSGLYLGVELVRDRVTLEPATEETAAICERMLDLGVVIQPTGDHLCVLKVKPPLCLDVAGADFFVDTLEHVLSTGW